MKNNGDGIDTLDCDYECETELATVPGLESTILLYNWTLCTTMPHQAGTRLTQQGWPLSTQWPNDEQCVHPCASY